MNHQNHHTNEGWKIKENQILNNEHTLDGVYEVLNGSVVQRECLLKMIKVSFQSIILK